MLEEMGISLYSERGPYSGFSLLRSCKLPPLIFTPEEATVLYMGANLVQDIWGKPFMDEAAAETSAGDHQVGNTCLEGVFIVSSRRLI
jgi:predicted DNA-binding transcriptional regulator YafY